MPTVMHILPDKPTTTEQILHKMAAKQMKKVASHLTCSICYELYKKPKYLPCYHSYCEGCLVKLQKGSDITCPECRKTSAIPTGGIEQLQNNFFINRIIDEVVLKEKKTAGEEVHCDACSREEDPAVVLCFDCGMFLCNHCYELHKYNRGYQSHILSQLKELRVEKKNINVPPKIKPLMCQEHNMELNLYCDTCEQLICHYCVTTDHNGHQHNTVKKMASKHRTELDKIIEPVDKMINELSKDHQKATATRDKIQIQATKLDQRIDDYYNQLQQQLLQQREQLKKELQDVCAQKKKAVSLQLEQIEHNQAQLESMKKLSEDVKNGSDQEAVLMKKQVTEDVKRLTDCYEELKTAPTELANMKFIPVEQYRNWFPQFANVFYGDADPLNSVAENIPLLAYANDEIKFVVATKRTQDRLCSKGGSKIVSFAQLNSTGVVIPVVIKDNQDGRYCASFVASQFGKVRLSVKINGRDIKGSPYTIAVRNHHTLGGGPNKVFNDGGRMGAPWGIAFGKAGMWGVADSSNHCVYTFDSQDQMIKKFGCKGKGNGQFDSPAGVAFDDDNYLYVVDNNNHRVQKLDVNGKYMLQFGSCGSNNGQMNHPLGIAIHCNRVFVVDQGNNRISVFHCDGNFIRIFGQSSLLDKPFDVAVDNSNQILIANYFNHCISIFTLDGNYVKSFGTYGANKGQLSYPSSLTIDINGFILVTESGNNRVSIFDMDGVFVHCFESSTPFSLLRGIALHPNGGVYIGDHGSKKIKIFST